MIFSETGNEKISVYYCRCRSKYTAAKARSLYRDDFKLNFQKNVFKIKNFIGNLVFTIT